MQRTKYSAHGDVEQMYKRLTARFFVPKDCNHTVYDPRCTFKKNGDCRVCDENVDAVRARQQ